MTKSQIRQKRKHKRKKQKRINGRLKKNLFGHLVICPCCYCKSVFLYVHLTIEHIVPLCLGGTNESSNIALACAPCNHKRGKEAWSKKQESNKIYYEQYYFQYRNKNRARITQES